MNKLKSLIESGLVDRENGTIFDTRTNLLWQQESPDGTYTWEDAHNYCKSLRLAGHTDWRLPTIEELKTLINKKYMPTIDPIFNCKSWWYWSSSTDSVNPNYAWFVGFYVGYVFVVPRDDDNCVRAVCVADCIETDVLGKTNLKLLDYNTKVKEY